MTVFIFYDYSDNAISYIATTEEQAKLYENKTGKHAVRYETDGPLPDEDWYSVNYYTFSMRYASLMQYPPSEEEEYIHICIYDQPASDGRIYYEMHGAVRAKGCKEAKDRLLEYMDAIEMGTFVKDYGHTFIGEKTHRKYYRIEL